MPVKTETTVFHEAGFVSSRRCLNGIAKTAAPRAGVRDRGGGRWSGWCKVYPHEDVRAARVRVVKSDNTRATGSGLTALKEEPVRKGVRRRVRCRDEEPVWSHKWPQPVSP